MRAERGCAKSRPVSPRLTGEPRLATPRLARGSPDPPTPLAKGSPVGQARQRLAKGSPGQARQRLAKARQELGTQTPGFKGGDRVRCRDVGLSKRGHIAP
eukprot:gene13959-biopygen11696